ncbi:MAG TPA: signal peptidase II [Candidatus Polarisedimenticolaceae bacterium]|nr:signal peptidase II [Candidatus Polarisedimenticolaceae bacterium]
MSLLEALVARRAYYLLSALVLVADQLAKVFAHALLRPHGAVEVIPDLFNLSYSRNAGGLFGYFSGWPDPWRTLLLTILPLGAIALIAVFIARGDAADRRSLVGLALILGGAAGNLIDRIARGEVVDFLDVYASSPRLSGWLLERFGTAHWPTFNLADSAIVCGAGLLLLSLLRPVASSSEAAQAEEPR